MSLFKSSPSVRTQLEQIANEQQLQMFENKIIQHSIETISDALHFQFWREEQVCEAKEYHFSLAQLEWLQVQTNDDQIAYGGNQYWWKHKHFFNAGCGTVAACNIVYYIARYNNQPDLLRYSSLLDRQPIAQNDFLAYMEDFVQYLTPTCEGIPSVSYFQRGFEQYIHSVGYGRTEWFVLSVSNKTVQSILDAALFIRNHLQANRPIGCLHWFKVGNMQVFNPIEAKEMFTNMNWHWVTITELYQYQNDWRIVVSSCGLRYELDFLHFLQGSPALITASFVK